MRQLLQIIIRDRTTNEQYKTPNHDDDKRKDDYHHDIKNELKRLLGKKIKSIYGNNGDFEVDNGEIIYISRKINEITGNPHEKIYRTNISAEDYFERVQFLVLRTVSGFTCHHNIDFSIHFSFSGENCLKITIEF